jgi:hypothetical protein
MATYVSAVSIWKLVVNCYYASNESESGEMKKEPLPESLPQKLNEMKPVHSCWKHSD